MREVGNETDSRPVNKPLSHLLPTSKTFISEKLPRADYFFGADRQKLQTEDRRRLVELRRRQQQAKASDFKTEATGNNIHRTCKLSILKTFSWPFQRNFKGASKYFRPTSRYFRYGLLILTLLILSVAPWLSSFLNNSAYTLSPAAELIVNNADKSLDSSTVYNSKTKSYEVNPNGLKPTKSTYPNVLVGQPGNGLYSATLPTNLSGGISVTDNANHVSFGLTPQFKASQGKHLNGHFIYPLGSGSIQAIYTAKSTEVSEDLVLNSPVGNVLSFPYSLKLPTGFKAFNLAGGAIAIENGGSVVFQLSNPTIKESNGQPGGKSSNASANLVLKNNQLSLLASGLNNLNYPISIDPSITINSSTSLLTGNDEGGINIATNQFSTGALTGGAFNNTIASCPGGWTLNSATYCTNTSSLPVATEQSGAVEYNDYAYVIGGCTSSTCPTAVVDYAQINSNGSLGSWTATTSLPSGGEYALTSVAYNGYMYVLGGSGAGETAVVDYAPINPNGTLGSWTATTSLPSATANATSVVYNGYLYEIGGCSYSTCPTAVVDYAPINSNGTLGSWTATTSLPTAIYQFSAVVYNGYIYEMGGYTTVAIANVYYAPVNSNGTLGSWTATTSLPTATEDGSSVVYNGYVYEIGGYTSSWTATVDYVPINSDGTLGSWTATTSIPTPTYAIGVFYYNGYVYMIGGDNGGQSATVDYASVSPAGWVNSPNATTANAWAATTSLTTGVYWAASFAYNGYAYELGGYNSGGTVITTTYYAPINSNGTIGSWTATTSLLAATAKAVAVAYDGYAYIMTGVNNSGVLQTVVDYAPINSNGTLGSWTATTAYSTATEWATGFAYNNKMYIIGGYTGSASAVVKYSTISATGTLGAWTATTSLPSATYRATSVSYDGFAYEIGGENPSATTTVDYAPINSTGALGSWTATTTLPAATYYSSSVVYNGYIYEIGGCATSCPSSVIDYVPINNNGTIGTWSATTSIPTATQYETSIAYNGYVYILGGNSASTAVDYALINNGGPGEIGSWTATTSLLPGAVDFASTVTYNNYIYELYGTSVSYAPFNSNGSLGSWTATSSLPAGTSIATSVASNNFIYEIGGNAGGVAVTTVDYAPINSNGTLGSWTATTALPVATEYSTSIVYNGYVYEIGGGNTSSGPTSTVYYALINSDGTLGAWNTTTSLPSTTYQSTSVVHNGYIYILGGEVQGSPGANVNYAPINSDGTLGSWTATTPLPTTPYGDTSVGYNGYIYEIGGYNNTSYLSTVYYAPINSNGTLGSWTATTSLLSTASYEATAVAYNGYVYTLGGWNGSATAAVN
ncbi:MAG: hypothetical protein ACREF7_03215, partial [Candidatus Saccharimonadales bacterium]